jgi:hypothetical protein
VPLRALGGWARSNMDRVHEARERFDGRLAAE